MCTVVYVRHTRTHSMRDPPTPFPAPTLCEISRYPSPHPHYARSPDTLPRTHTTVHSPNSVGKFLPFVVSTTVILSYIGSKMYLYIPILWILLFQMICCSSPIVQVFIAILAVYETHHRLTELGGSSLFLSASQKRSLITTLLINYIGKFNFMKKRLFSCFRREMERRCMRHFCRADEALS